MSTRWPTIRFPGGRPWGWASLWGLFLAPMFFGTYIAALEITALRSSVPALVFAWEQYIPFLAWTVLPYWSEDFFYGLSLFVCRTRSELNTHALRLVLAQAVAIPIFLLLPLRLTSVIPPDTGIWQPWFDALGDVVGRPFNMAPSLHIAIVVILGVRYIRHIPWPWRSAVYGWGFLIGLSTLTAFQHHFFDVPTGAMLGAFCVWALPEEGQSPFRGLRISGDGHRLRLAVIYAAGGSVLVAMAWALGGAAWWLLWPAQSLWLVALGYAMLGAAVFQKDARGQLSGAGRALLWPYLVGARISAALFTRNLSASEVMDGVRLGCVADGKTAASVLDLSAELPALPHEDWFCLPSLDLIPPTPDLLMEAARHIEDRVESGQPILVCCALGFSRSAAVVSTWLAAFGRARDVEEALGLVRAARPAVVLGSHHRQVIETAVQRFREEHS